jgi:hypothetical protein
MHTTLGDFLRESFANRVYLRTNLSCDIKSYSSHTTTLVEHSRWSI